METNWILVPVHNGLSMTQKAVGTMLKQTVPEPRIFLIDNASTDGTEQWARCMHPMVVHLRKDPPLGVAASWNKGLSLLFSNGAEHVLVVNNDVELQPRTYEHLLNDGGGFVTVVGVDRREMLIDNLPDPSKKRPHPDFSCFLIRRWVWEKVGKFDERFMGAYCEDADYHARMHQKDVKAMCIDYPYLHWGSGTIKFASQEGADRVRKCADANRKYFEEKWGFGVGTPEYYKWFGTPPPPA